MDDNRKLEIEYNPDNGNLVINISDIFDNLGEDKLEELAETYSWHSKARKELVKDVRENFAGKNYNESTYDIRKAIFLMTDFEYDFQEELAKKQIIYNMQRVVEELIKQNAELKIINYRLSVAQDLVYNHLKQIIGDDLAYKIHSLYHNVEFNGTKEDNPDKKYTHELAEKLTENVEYKKMVEEWCNTMFEIFNKESTQGE